MLPLPAHPRRPVLRIDRDLWAQGLGALGGLRGQELGSLEPGHWAAQGLPPRRSPSWVHGPELPSSSAPWASHCRRSHKAQVWGEFPSPRGERVNSCPSLSPQGTVGLGGVGAVKGRISCGWSRSRGPQAAGWRIPVGGAWWSDVAGFLHHKLPSCPSLCSEQGSGGTTVFPPEPGAGRWPVCSASDGVGEVSGSGFGRWEDSHAPCSAGPVSSAGFSRKDSMRGGGGGGGEPREMLGRKALPGGTVLSLG